MSNSLFRHCEESSNEDTTQHSRGAISRPSDNGRSLETEGAGNAGCTPHPLPRVQNKKTHAGQHRYAEITSALPAQMVLRLLRALLGVPGLLAPVALSIFIDNT